MSECKAASLTYSGSRSPHPQQDVAIGGELLGQYFCV